MEGKDAKPELNPSFHTLFEAYPAQRNQPVTRSQPYSRPEVAEAVVPPVQDISENARPNNEIEMGDANSTTINPANSSKKVATNETANNRPKKKPAARKRQTQKTQPSISAHIQPYNIVADLQQQRANISFGQLF